MEITNKSIKSDACSELIENSKRSYNVLIDQIVCCSKLIKNALWHL